MREVVGALVLLAVCSVIVFVLIVKSFTEEEP